MKACKLSVLKDDLPRIWDLYSLQMQARIYFQSLLPFLFLQLLVVIFWHSSVVSCYLSQKEICRFHYPKETINKIRPLNNLIIKAKWVVHYQNPSNQSFLHSSIALFLCAAASPSLVPSFS